MMARRRLRLWFALGCPSLVYCGGETAEDSRPQQVADAGGVGAVQTEVSPSARTLDDASSPTSTPPSPSASATVGNSAPAEPSTVNLDACRDEDLFVRISGDWFEGASTEFTQGCDASATAPYPRPAAYHQGLINDYQVVVEACNSERDEWIRLSARFDADVVDGQRVGTFVRASAAFHPRELEEGQSHGLQVLAFEETRVPVVWSRVSSAEPPSDEPYSGTAVLAIASGEIDAQVEFSACHVANLRSVIVR